VYLCMLYGDKGYMCVCVRGMGMKCMCVVCRGDVVCVVFVCVCVWCDFYKNVLLKNEMHIK